MIRTYLVQSNPTVGAIEQNLHRILAALGRPRPFKQSLSSSLSLLFQGLAAQ